MGEVSASPGAFPKFVFPVLGTVPFRYSAEGFQQSRTSKQNSDQPAEYSTNPISFSSPSSPIFWHNLRSEQSCHIIIYHRSDSSFIHGETHSALLSLTSCENKSCKYPPCGQCTYVLFYRYVHPTQPKSSRNRSYRFVQTNERFRRGTFEGDP